MKYKNIEELDPKSFIILKGARANNLKNIDVAIPRNKFIVITGVSGSGKSSLAFDTIFAEGQRMYVESLSAYARQFLGRMEKPPMDYIKGVSPAIAIEQKVLSKNPRSTVGTTTEIYDYLKLLFARIGKTYSPVSDKPVRKHTVDDVLNYLQEYDEGTKFMVSAPLHHKEDRTLRKEMELLLQQGYSRISVDGDVQTIEDYKPREADRGKIEIIIDRAKVSKDEAEDFRVSDSVQTAFFEGLGFCHIYVVGHGTKVFSDKFELDGISFEEPSLNFFSFNNPHGACRTCEGFGHVLGIDPDLVIPDKTLSVYEGAIAPWRGEKMSAWLEPLLKNGIHFDFPIHRPVNELTPEEIDLLWEGNKYFDGLNAFFKYLTKKTHKIQYRVMLSRYRGRTKCPDCKGTRLRKDAAWVKIGGKSIMDVVLMSLDETLDFFKNLSLSEHDQKVAERILKEITNRLKFLHEVGLSYLTLNRLSSSLSGGEHQRIKLATSLGSALVGSMYILDEPSIGLHPKDTHQLIQVIKRLRDLGNTVIVVEHEEEVMRQADEIIDIGPDAGSHGGNLVFQGTLEEIKQDTHSHTADFLNHREIIPMPSARRNHSDFIRITGATENNLQSVNADIPLHALTIISGVSGSGKSTLVNKVLYPALKKRIDGYGEFTGAFKELSGSLNKIEQIEYVDQNPIGKSSRSNPVTYIKAYDAIRQLFADQPLAKQRGYKPAHFSFNVDGGRCEMCQGEGVVKIEMQFMADIFLTCESCDGKRFKQDVLETLYRDKNIADVLDMTVDDAITFFEKEKKIIAKLQPLQDVGLGYVRLGQSSNSLSGGEAQRVKLASFIAKGNQEKHTLFIFDEPTTGLHFHDIQNLLNAFNALLDNGHSIIVIEHNMDVIKCADWVIDLGPEGGKHGGKVLFQGPVEKLLESKQSYTAQYLAEKLTLEKG